MAERPVYEARESAPFFNCLSISFDWNGGFAKSQKQKNITALHEGYSHCRPGKNVLEISSKSMQEGGEALSAFFIPKFVPEIGKSVPVECVFQAGKTFANGGPYRDLLHMAPRDAKRDERLKTSGRLTCFMFEGREYPLNPTTIFYDYIYINALLENEELAKAALQYDAFTDIEFNPDKSLNCQAKACATFVSLSRLGLLDKVKDFDSFLALYGMQRKPEPAPGKEAAPAQEQQKTPAVTVKPGDTVIHKAFGEGVVERVEGAVLVISFPKAGEKKLGLDWCKRNCEFKG